MAPPSSTSCNVRVVARFRPLTERETDGVDEPPVDLAIDPSARRVVLTADALRESYTLDRVFDTDASQRDVYENAAAPLAADVCSGFNATFMAYGQTGSGKTFTMCVPPCVGHAVAISSLALLASARNELPRVATCARMHVVRARVVRRCASARPSMSLIAQLTCASIAPHPTAVLLRRPLVWQVRPVRGGRAARAELRGYPAARHRAGLRDDPRGQPRRVLHDLCLVFGSVPRAGPRPSQPGEEQPQDLGERGARRVRARRDDCVRTRARACCGAALVSTQPATMAARP